MKSKKKKQFSVGEIVNSATGVEPPALFETAEINGVVVKVYNFIREHSKLQKVSMPDNEYDSNDYAVLATYKNELESQLKLNHQACIEQYDFIKWKASILLKRKINKIPANERNTQKLKAIIYTVRCLMEWIMRGMDSERLQKSLENSTLKHEATVSGTSIDALQVFSTSKKFIEKNERIVSRSADLYLQYLNLHSEIYRFDVNEFLSKPAKTLDEIDLWIYTNIPNSPNKKVYKQAFEIVSQHPDPNGVSTQNLIRYIDKYINKNKLPNLDISKRSLEDQLPKFVPTLIA